MWKKLLGLLRKILNAANKGGYIPSKDPGVSDINIGKPHDPTFPDVR